MSQSRRNDLDAAVGRIVLKTGSYDKLPVDSIVFKEIEFVFPYLPNSKRLDFLIWASYYFKDSSSIYTYIIDVAQKYNLLNDWKFLLIDKYDNSNDEEMKAIYATLLRMINEK